LRCGRFQLFPYTHLEAVGGNLIKTYPINQFSWKKKREMLLKGKMHRYIFGFWVETTRESSFLCSIYRLKLFFLKIDTHKKGAAESVKKIGKMLFISGILPTKEINKNMLERHSTTSSNSPIPVFFFSRFVCISRRLQTFHLWRVGASPFMGVTILLSINFTLFSIQFQLVTNVYRGKKLNTGH
jgi:hypothetical protein